MDSPAISALVNLRFHRDPPCTMKPSEKRYLELLKTAAKENLDLFLNKNKTNREKMVVRAFLRCLGIKFSETELVVGPEEPVDISFRSARFQIREMLGGRKRGLIMRERLRRFQAAKSINDVMGSWTFSKPLSFVELSQDLAKSLSGKASRYGAKGCAKLDALVYVNLDGRHLYPRTAKLDPAVTQELGRQGWRSVSMVFIPYSAVIVAKPDCPSFLRDRAGRIRRKWARPDGWFDP